MEGSCHCGAVRFEVAGEIYGFKHCHCQSCRKIHGTAFGSSARTAASGFRVVAGAEQVRRYESSPGKYRCFCATCGSHLFAVYDADPSFVSLRVGVLDDPGALQPKAHIWVSQKAPWHRITDDLPQFPEGYPGA